MTTKSTSKIVWQNEFKASVVVFLVAVPLCLGIALASNAPLSAGILSGIMGGILVGLLGGSQVSVSGPAAGLTVIVASAIGELGSFQSFAAAVMLAGAMQFVMGWLKAGDLGNYFPSSVIKGMLAAIGLILILKQIPHAIGWDSDFMGDDGFGSLKGQNTFTDLVHALNAFHWGAVIISLTALFIILFWDKVLVKKVPALNLVPSALVAVVASVCINEFLFSSSSSLAITGSHLVQLPYEGGIQSFLGAFSLPDFNALSNLATWKVALTMALVASIETLLSLDAADKIDPLHRSSKKNKELRAQGIGNFLSGLAGGLPLTAVIVRTSANVAGGAQSRYSAVFHGLWLLLAVVLFPSLLNKIPLSVLATILILVGFKLTKPELMKAQWNLGWNQFIPFIVTIVAILFTDLLKGIGIGFFVGIIFILKANYHAAVVKVNLEDYILIRFSKDVSFLHKPIIRAMLRDLPDGVKVVIDGSRSVYIDRDIVELVEEFIASAPNRNIDVDIKRSPLSLCELFKE